MYWAHRKIGLLGITIFSIFLLTSFISNQSYATNPDPVVSFKGGAITVEYKGCVGNDPVVCTWTVANNSNKKQVSHIVIGLNSCTESLTATNPALEPTELIPALDPQTEVFGIKWEEGPEAPNSQDFQMLFNLSEGVLLLDDLISAEHYEIGIKAGPFSGSKTGLGPLCVMPEINITESSASVKWGETASVSGTAANFDPLTSTISIDWGDGTEDTIIDPATEDWGPVTHEYADSQSGLSPTITATLNLNPGSVSDTVGIDVTIHTTSLNDPVIPTSALWGDTFPVSNTLTDSNAGVCTGAVSCPSPIMGEDITYTGSAVETPTIHTSTVSGEDLIASQNTGAGQDVTADFAGNAAYTSATAFSLMEIDKHVTDIIDLTITSSGATEQPVTIIGILIDKDNEDTGISFQPIILSEPGNNGFPNTETGGIVIQDPDPLSSPPQLEVRVCPVGPIEVDPTACVIEGTTPNNRVMLTPGTKIIFEREVAYATLNTEQSQNKTITLQIDDRPELTIATDVDAAGTYIILGPMVNQITINSITGGDDEPSLGLIRIIGTTEEANIKVIDEGLSTIAAAFYEEIPVGGGSFGTGGLAQVEAAQDLEIRATFPGNNLYETSFATAQYSIIANLQDETQSGFGALVNVVADSGIGISGAICGGDVDADALCTGWERNNKAFKVDGKNYRLVLPDINETVPNFYVEIDYMTGHLPDATAIANIESVFLTNGIIVTTFVDEEITHVDNLNVWTDTDSDETNDFNNIKANFYQPANERSSGTGQSNVIGVSGLSQTLDISGITVTTPTHSARITPHPAAAGPDLTQGTITIKTKLTTQNSVTPTVGAISAPSPGAGLTITGTVTGSVLPIPGTEHIISIKVPFLTNAALTGVSLGTVSVPITFDVDPGTITLDTMPSSPTVSSTVREAYAQMVRYIVYGHSMGGASGTAEFEGNDAVITLGEGFGETDGGHAGTEGTTEEQGGTLMHEYGHWLGLRHGGDVDVNCKPVYVSLMSYSRQTPAYLGGNWLLDYSHGNMDSIEEDHLDEALGLRIDDTVNLRTPFAKSNGAIVKQLTSSIPNGEPNRQANYKADGMITTDPTFVAVDLNNFGIPGCNTAEISADPYHDYDDWANLEFNFRDTVSGSFDASTAIYPTTISDLSFSFNQLAELQGFVLDDPIMDPPPNADGTTEVKRGKTTPLKMPLFMSDGVTFLTNAAVHAEYITGIDQVPRAIEDKNGNRFWNFDGNSGFYSLNWKVPRNEGFDTPVWVTVFIGEAEDNAIVQIPAVLDLCPLIIDPNNECPTFKVIIKR